MRPFLLVIPLLLSACGDDEMLIHNRLSLPVSMEVRAPNADLRGGCKEAFQDRFCAEEYEVVGVLDVSANEERLITISDPVTDDQCTNILWLRLVRLGEVGPVDDPGTLLQMPTNAEIEVGSGALHSVAFPQMTVRIDEVGTGDANQSTPPNTCESLGKTPRI